MVLAPFERFVDESASLHEEISLAGPDFLFGADYEVCMRMGTSLRWGGWSLPEPVSLAIHPPQPAGTLQLEDLRLADGATFFKLTWPAFDTHPLCNLIEYRIRMQRVSRFKYMSRLSAEIAARSEESLAAQEKSYVVGTIRVRVPQKDGLARGFGDAYKDTEREALEFVHSIAADPECGYRFFVDAKHERYREVDGHQETPS
ncbi:unnamed protein product [Effrenium voratum]|uniref:Uncharacterized protein n=1 Tax=Effrenium voratum TaxID=2562239 RepID=A0AA36IRY4_9DINO|nr:unnamed protein product [Effrenium voratum]